MPFSLAKLSLRRLGLWIGFWLKEEGSRNSSLFHHSWCSLVIPWSLWIFPAGIPPPPLLKLDPLSQREKEGDCLFLLCSAEGSLTEKKFHFYRDGVEITSSQECLPKSSSKPADLLQSGSLRILHALFNHSMEFACNYEEKRNNRWIMSSWNQGLNVPGEPVGGRLDVFNSWMWDHQ